MVKGTGFCPDFVVGSGAVPQVFCRSEGGELTVEVFDLQGRCVQRFQRQLAAGGQTFTLPGNLSPGAYGYRARLGQHRWQGHWVQSR
jgi:hypothetical protein